MRVTILGHTVSQRSFACTVDSIDAEQWVISLNARDDIETATMQAAPTGDASYATAWVAGPHTEYSEALADAYADHGTAGVAELETVTARRKIQVSRKAVDARQRGFQEGYQAALRDVRNAADPAAWIADNLHDETASAYDDAVQRDIEMRSAADFR